MIAERWVRAVLNEEMLGPDNVDELSIYLLEDLGVRRMKLLDNLIEANLVEIELCELYFGGDIDFAGLIG